MTDDTATGTPARGSRTRTLLRLVSLALAVAAPVAVVRLRAAADAACDVGVNAGAAALGHLGPAALVLLVGVTGALLAHRFAPPAAALALTVALLAVACWVFLSSTWPPPGYPDAVRTCSDNVPAWWPTWLPRRGG